MGPIAVKSVSIHRRGRPILIGVDLTVHPGERVGLLGRSGTGKTSLLRVIAGLDRPDDGSVEIGGREIGGPPAGVTMIFQGDAVYEHLDVEGNIAFPLDRGRERDAERRVREAAGRFFLAGVLHRSPATLSAGQRRAVSTARAMIRSDVSLVLLDDPLVGTDQKLRERLFTAIVADRDLTVVFATREAGDVLRWADRAAVLAGGRMEQVGRPLDVLRRPASLEVAETMGELNRIPGRFSAPDGVVEVAGSRLAPYEVPEHLRHGQRLVIGVRPADLDVAPAGTPFTRRLRGTVGRVEPVGATQRVLFGLDDVAGVGFCAEIDAVHRLMVGDRVDWSVGYLRLYEPSTGAAL